MSKWHRLDVPAGRWKQLRAQTLARYPDCYYCGEPSEEADHRIPLSKGGESILDNLVGACRRCNRSKRDRDRPSSRPVLTRREQVPRFSGLSRLPTGGATSVEVSKWDTN